MCTFELNNILHYWFQKRSNDFSSFVATLLLRWSAYTFIYTLTLYLVYNTHNFLPGLLGYLILFAPQAFVPQRQFVDRGLPSPLHIPLVLKHFISTPMALIFTSPIKL